MSCKNKVHIDQFFHYSNLKCDPKVCSEVRPLTLGVDTVSGGAISVFSYGYATMKSIVWTTGRLIGLFPTL